MKKKRPHSATVVRPLPRVTAEFPTPPSAPTTPIIGIDARTLSHPSSCDRGIGHYTAHHLEALALEQPDWTFLIFLEDAEAKTWALDRLRELPNVQVRLMKDVTRTRMDLFHVPDLMGLAKEQPAPWELLPAGLPYSVVFYDLIPLVLRKEFIDLWPESARNGYLKRIGSLKRSKALILTISRHTKRDLAQFAEIDESRMVPIMAGLNQSADAVEPSPQRISEVLTAQGLDRPFFLVVGALDPHKRFTTTLTAFAETLKFHAIQLAVVGSVSNPTTRAYKEHFEEKNIHDVRFTGFLSREDLECLYRAATALVFPSAYEGFGFPVLEAMAQHCPVITSRASSLPEVAGDAALLVSPDDPAEIVAAMRRLLEEPQLRETLIQRGLQQARRFSWRVNAQATLDAWRPLLGLPEVAAPADRWAIQEGPVRPRVRWEGTQFVWHSLAHVNRQFCLGLLHSGAFELSLTPYEKDQFKPSAHAPFRPLMEAVNRPFNQPATVHVRHQWPPKFTPPAEGAWVMIQPWEFGGLPQDWIRPMSDLVDEIWTYTTWIRERYLESGVPADKVVVVPLGVDTTLFHPEGPRFPLRTRKRFRFLFLGGTIARKGIDVLLETYTRTFTAQDDVCLVIKGQGGGVYRGTDLDQAIRRIQRDPKAPEIEFMNGNMSEPELASIYRSCDAFVMPYRGEGFGLPIAEAMASGLPVIVTGSGAAMDFTHGDWAYRLPSQRFSLPNVDAHRPGPAGFWLEEPDSEALASTLKHVVLHPEEAREKGRQARAYAEDRLGWEHGLAIMEDRIRELSRRTPRRFAAPTDAKNGNPQALVFNLDWGRSEWVEVVLSYLEAFQPGEPVSLILVLPGGAGAVPHEEAQRRIVDLALRTGRERFPDIELVDSPEALPEVMARYQSPQTIPPGREGSARLVGSIGIRFAEARKRLTGA